MTAACGGTPNASPITEPSSPLHEVLSATQSQYGLPAEAGVVMHGDRALAVDAVGVRKLGEPTLVTVNDHFHYGSNVKAMTATMIATLVEEGRLSWASRPSDVFPEKARSFDPVLANVTLEQILSHRAGIVPLTEGAELAGVPPSEGSGAEQRAAFVDWALARQPSITPGRYLYSNAGYVVAAAMAERASGESWEGLMATRLLQPLGIEATFGWPAQDDPRQPWGHYLSNGQLVPHDPRVVGEQLPVYLWPAGGLSTSIEDYSRFLRLHLRGLRGANEILRSETFHRLHTPIGGTIGGGSTARYALGWSVVLISGVTSSAHDGSAGTFYVSAILQPDRDLAAAVVTNAGGQSAGAACDQAVLQLLDRYRTQ